MHASIFVCIFLFLLSLLFISLICAYRSLIFSYSIIFHINFTFLHLLYFLISHPHILCALFLFIFICTDIAKSPIILLPIYPNICIIRIYIRCKTEFPRRCHAVESLFRASARIVSAFHAVLGSNASIAFDTVP